MAYAATDLRLTHDRIAQDAVGVDLDVPFQTQHGPPDAGLQNEMRAGVGAQNTRHRAGTAKIRAPLLWLGILGQQAAFFALTAAIVIPVKITTFDTGRCSHGSSRR